MIERIVVRMVKDPIDPHTHIALNIPNSYINYEFFIRIDFL